MDEGHKIDVGDSFIADESFVTKCTSSGVSFINGNFYRSKCKKIIAQSPDLTLESIPVVRVDRFRHSFYDNDLPCDTFPDFLDSIQTKILVMTEEKEIYTGGSGSTSYPIFEQVPVTEIKNDRIQFKIKYAQS